MANKFTDCIKKLAAASDGRWTQEEATKLFNTMEEKANGLTQTEYGALKAPHEMRDIVEQAGRDHVKQQVLDAKLRRIRSQLDGAKMSNSVQAAEGYKSPKEFLESFLGGTQKDRFGGKGGLDAAIRGNVENLLKSFDADLEKIKTGEKMSAKDLLLKGELDERILAKKQQLEGGDKPLPEAQTERERVADKIAEVYHKHNDYLVDRQNDQGAGIAKLKGRGTMQSNNATNMLHGGFEKWRDFIAPLLDPKTFGGTEPNKFLESTYNAITTGVRLARSGDLKGASEEFSSSLAGGPSANKERLLHFSDASSQLKYIQSEYSHGSMASAMLNDLSRGMKNATMFEHMGTDPEQFFKDLKTNLAQVARKEVDRAPTLEDRAKAQLKVESLRNTTHAENILKNLTGYTSIDLNPTVSSFTNAWKAFLQSTSQTNAIFRVAPDLMNGPAELMVRGMPYVQAHWTYYRGLWEAMSHGMSKAEMGEHFEQVRAFQEQYGVALANKKYADIGGIKGLFSNNNYSLAERVNAGAARVNAFLYKWNGLHGWDEGLMQATRSSAARWMGDNAGKAFNELDNKQFVRGLRTYGIGENEWNTLRQGAFDIGTGDKAVTGDSINNLSDETIGKYLQSQGKSISEYNIRRAKSDLGTLLNKYVYDAGYQTIMMPDAATKALLGQGTQKGTVGWFLSTLIGHMKGFMVNNFRRNMGRSIYGFGAESFTEAMTNKASVGMLANNIAQGLVLYAAGDALYHVTQGSTPPDYMPWSNKKEFMHVLAGGGGMGLYAEYLMRDYTHGMSLTSAVAGPTGGEIDRAAQLVSGYKNYAMGTGKAPNSQAVRFAADQIPGAKTAGVAPILNYLVVNRLRDALQPGSMQQQHKKIEKETGSHYFLPENPK